MFTLVFSFQDLYTFNIRSPFSFHYLSLQTINISTFFLILTHSLNSYLLRLRSQYVSLFSFGESILYTSLSTSFTRTLEIMDRFTHEVRFTRRSQFCNLRPYTHNKVSLFSRSHRLTLLLLPLVLHYF